MLLLLLLIWILLESIWATKISKSWLLINCWLESSVGNLIELWLLLMLVLLLLVLELSWSVLININSHIHTIKHVCLVRQWLELIGSNLMLLLLWKSCVELLILSSHLLVHLLLLAWLIKVSSKLPWLLLIER